MLYLLMQKATMWVNVQSVSAHPSLSRDQEQQTPEYTTEFSAQRYFMCPASLLVKPVLST